VRPNEGDDEWISGEYPAYRVRDGDRFIAEIGCLRDSPDCELRFELDYREDDGDVENLDSWFESYDGESTEIDIDLDDLEGESVQFILSVTNRGRTRDANGFWFVPYISNDREDDELVISWRQEGGVSDICSDVKIYMIGSRSAQARARNCGLGVRDSGSARLSNAEFDQVLEWIERFNSFEYEVDTPTSEEPLTETITFIGEGSREFSSNDLRDMQEFMLNLYYSIIF
jgi:hypothetical protein